MKCALDIPAVEALVYEVESSDDEGTTYPRWRCGRDEMMVLHYIPVQAA
jgi:hypothetical protein